MKNLAFTFFLLLFAAMTATAQDLIILKNGDEIQAKVLEIQLTEIKYKRFNHQDGPTITLAKKDVFLIRYENGTKEVFQTMEEPTKQEQPVQNPATQRSFNKPVLTSNRVSEENATLFIGLSVPMGELKDIDTGDAKIGISAGMETTSWFSNNVGWLGHLSFSYNKGNSDYYESGGFTNFWFLTGLQIGSYNPSSDFQANLSLLGGANWQLTSGEVEDEWNGHFQFAFGGGISINVSNVELGRCV